MCSPNNIKAMHSTASVIPSKFGNFFPSRYAPTRYSRALGVDMAANPKDTMARSAVETWNTELYQELRQMASAQLARLPPGKTLQATALVHEVWLRLG